VVSLLNKFDASLTSISIQSESQVTNVERLLRDLEEKFKVSDTEIAEKAGTLLIKIDKHERTSLKNLNGNSNNKLNKHKESEKDNGKEMNHENNISSNTKIIDEGKGGFKREKDVSQKKKRENSETEDASEEDPNSLVIDDAI